MDAASCAKGEVKLPARREFWNEILRHDLRAVPDRRLETADDQSLEATDQLTKPTEAMLQ